MTAIPTTGRSAAVAAWCARQIRPDGEPIELSKVDLAQHVLDQSRGRHLLAAQHRDILHEVDEQLREILRRATIALVQEAADLSV
jgi:hypothetical protein